MIQKEDILQLADEFKSCQKALAAIGDETRQHIVLMMLEGECCGIRVGEISKKTSLSRPAVSHHLKILKDGNIVKMRREGTKNYYYLDAEDFELKKLIALFQHTQEILKEVPDRSGESEI